MGRVLFKVLWLPVTATSVYLLVWLLLPAVTSVSSEDALQWGLVAGLLILAGYTLGLAISIARWEPVHSAPEAAESKPRRLTRWNAAAKEHAELIDAIAKLQPVIKWLAGSFLLLVVMIWRLVA